MIAHSDGADGSVAKAVEHGFVVRCAEDRGAVEVQFSGLIPSEVHRSTVRRSRGAGVLVPGPLKLAQRCRDKQGHE